MTNVNNLRSNLKVNQDPDMHDLNPSFWYQILVPVSGEENLGHVPWVQQK